MLFSKCEQIHIFSSICSNLLKKSLTVNFRLCAVHKFLILVHFCKHQWQEHIAKFAGFNCEGVHYQVDLEFSILCVFRFTNELWHFQLFSGQGFSRNFLGSSFSNPDIMCIKNEIFYEIQEVIEQASKMPTRYLEFIDDRSIGSIGTQLEIQNVLQYCDRKFSENRTISYTYVLLRLIICLWKINWLKNLKK